MLLGAARMARPGRRRAQRPDARAAGLRATRRSSFLRTIAALLAGIVEKGRLTAEVEARLAQLTALDAARAELLSVVTHDLRTPLSVVRVYVDLLADVATGPVAAAPIRPTAETWRTAAVDQLARLDRLVDSILASVRGDGLTGLSRAPFDAVAAVDETVETLRLLLRPAPDPLGAAGRVAYVGDRRRHALPPGARAAPRERVEVRPDRRRREHRGLAGRRRDPGLRHRRRPGRPDRGLGERLRAVRARRGPRAVARLGHRAVRGAAADERDGRPRSSSSPTATRAAGSWWRCPRASRAADRSAGRVGRPRSSCAVVPPSVQTTVPGHPATPRPRRGTPPARPRPPARPTRPIGTARSPRARGVAPGPPSK